MQQTFVQKECALVMSIIMSKGDRRLQFTSYRNRDAIRYERCVEYVEQHSYDVSLIHGIRYSE